MPQHQRDHHYRQAARAYAHAWGYTALPSGPASLFAADREFWVGCAAQDLSAISEPWPG